LGFRRLFVSLIVFSSAYYLFCLPTVRIKDIAYLSGIRDNQLSGIGIATGLAGKGDSSGSPLLKQSLSNLLSSFGIEVGPDEVKSKNCAVVMVTVELPPFVRPGDRVNATISSIGDARSLEGGILLQTNLQAANGRVYAVAQGRIVIPKTSNVIETVGTITGGGIVEREIISVYAEDGKISIVLRNPDFVTASKVAQVITEAFGAIQVKSKDAALIEVTIPQERQGDPVNFIAEIESLTLVPDISGKVVIDPNSGVIIIGENVKVGKVAVSYREISIAVGSFYGGTGESGDKFVIEDTTTVNDLVDVLKTVGLKTDIIIGILQAIERAGALFGTLIIM
jgi:flagellar P-ring protein precursor FlgI